MNDRDTFLVKGALAMKPKSIFCLVFGTNTLSLIILLSALVGCASVPLPLGEKSDKVALRIAFSSTELDTNRCIHGYLILSNEGSEDIHYTSRCELIRGMDRGGNYSIDWIPGYFSSDRLTIEELAQTLQILVPGKSGEVPFELYVGTNQVIRVKAHYGVIESYVRGLNMWTNSLDAGPITIQLTK